MSINIISANMKFSSDTGYIGQVQFNYENHKRPYGITLHSKDLQEWMYSLNFAAESGSEEEILQVEEVLEEDDDLFDDLVEAAISKLQK